MCATKVVIGVIIGIFDFLLISSIIFSATNLRQGCDERRTDCIVLIQNDKCMIQYNGSTDYSCSFEGYQCETQYFENDKTVTCYKPNDNDDVDFMGSCPTIECINEGMLIALIVLSIIGFAMLILSCVFLCCFLL